MTIPGLKTLWIEYGNGITILYQGNEILKLVFSVDKEFEKIEIITMIIDKLIDIKEGVIKDGRNGGYF